MEGTYPDGYKMTYQGAGSYPTLTDPQGTTAQWDSDGNRWVNSSGTPMPSGWGNDHAPMEPPPGASSAP